jgi:hypothetical protein
MVLSEIQQAQVVKRLTAFCDVGGTLTKRCPRLQASGSYSTRWPRIQPGYSGGDLSKMPSSRPNAFPLER